jgi:outer membrane biosynthesis protein TonB
MIGSKRFIRPGFVISAACHAGALVLGLLFAGTRSFESVPPDAMLVDIVPPNEAARFEGTPADATTSGSERASNSNSATASTPRPPPKPTAESPQQAQQRPSPQRESRQAISQPQISQPQTPQPEAAEPLPAQVEQPSQATQPTQSRPRPEEPSDQPGVGEMFALPLVVPGGPLGGGFPAPAVPAPQVAHDDTAAFRERVSACSALPTGIEAGEKVRIVLRVSLKPDGSLALPPQLIEASASPKWPALMQSAVEALEKCQPYTMLPAEKYKMWKTLDLVFTPLNFYGR